MDDKLAERLTADLEEWIGRGRHHPAPTTIDPALVRQLESLGYID